MNLMLNNIHIKKILLQLIEAEPQGCMPVTLRDEVTACLTHIASYSYKTAFWQNAVRHNGV